MGSLGRGESRSPSEVLAAPLEVRVRFAGQSALPAEFQWALLGDKTAKVRAALAGNPALLPELQEALMREEPRVTVREALASNPTLTPGNQEIMTTTERESVLMRLACNPRLTDETQTRLRSHPVYGLWMSQNGTPNEDTQQWMAKNGSATVRHALARNRTLGGAVLSMLLADRDRQVRAAAACNSNVPKEVQLAIAQDCTVDQARELAQNQSLNPEAASLLLRHDDEVVLDRLTRNRNTPDKDRQQAASQLEHLRSHPRSAIAAGDLDEDSPPFVALMVHSDGVFGRMLFPEDDGAPSTAEELMAVLSQMSPATETDKGTASLISALRASADGLPSKGPVRADSFAGALSLTLERIIALFDHTFPHEMGEDEDGWEEFQFDQTSIAFCPRGTDGLLLSLEALPPSVELALGVRAVPLSGLG